MRLLLTSILLSCVSLVFAQQERADIRRGNKQYNDSNYTEAEVHYRRGLDINDHSFEAHPHNAADPFAKTVAEGGVA